MFHGFLNTSTAGRNLSGKFSAGFTLLELLIYIFLFSLVLSGLILSFYGFEESSRRTEEKIRREQEAEFILGKIDWLTYGGEIFEPAAGMESEQLGLRKNNENFLVRLDNGLIYFGPALSLSVLNNSRFKVSNLTFRNRQIDNSGRYYLETELAIDGEIFRTVHFIK